MGMTAISEIRKNVKKDIDLADDTTLKMIQAILEVQKKATIEHSFDNEMERRFDEMGKGKGTTLTIDQLEERARTAFSKRMHTKK